MTRTSICLVLGAVIALAAPLPAAAAPPGPAACGRACLGGLLGRYLAAIVADPEGHEIELLHLN